MPGFGAFAIMTSVRFWGEARMVVWLGLTRSRRSRPSMSKIVAHDPAKDKPCGSYRPLRRTADFGLSNSRVIAHRDFDDAKSREGTLQDHFHRPAVGGLFERKRTKHIGASGAKGTEDADLQTVQTQDQTGREPVTANGSPSQRTRVTG